MTNIKQSELLWILRGMRLGRLLNSCARTVSRHLEAFRRQIELKAASAPERRAPRRPMPPVDSQVGIRESAPRPAVDSASGNETRPRKRIPPRLSPHAAGRAERAGPGQATAAAQPLPTTSDAEKLDAY